MTEQAERAPRRREGRPAGCYLLGVENDTIDILNLDLLIKQLALAMGLAMVLGNAYAIYKHRKGEKPKDETGEFRRGRAYWLLGVGALIALWGGISLLA